MRERGSHLAKQADAAEQFNLLPTPPCSLFRRQARRDIDNIRQNNKPVWRLNRIQTNFDWKFAAVLAASKQFPACTHRPHFGRSEKAGAVGRMCAHESLWYQYVNDLTNEVVTRIPE